jgi:hypothetical protein
MGFALYRGEKRFEARRRGLDALSQSDQLPVASARLIPALLRRRRVAVCDLGFQLERRMEEDNATWAYRHLLACLGVAANPLSLVARVEAPERRDFNRFTALKRAGNLAENHLNHRGRRVAVQSDLAPDHLGESSTRNSLTGHDDAPSFP